jgi:hypothetical protein
MIRSKNTYKLLEEEWSNNYRQFIIDNIAKFEVIELLLNNPNITWEMIANYLTPDCDWWFISRCPKVTWNIIIDNPHLPWEWKFMGIGSNPNITWKIIQDHPGYAWDWDSLSFNPTITWDIINTHPNKPWNWTSISMNPNITPDIVNNNPDKPWDRWVLNNSTISKTLSSNSCIIGSSIDFHTKSSRFHIAADPNLTWGLIEQSYWKYWDYSGISRNPNITWEIIHNYPDRPWNWYHISLNTMEKGREKWIKAHRLRIIKVLQIQRHWRNCTCNPMFRLARKYLELVYKK